MVINPGQFLAAKSLSRESYTVVEYISQAILIRYEVQNQKNNQSWVV
uniref:Uncharacterized protein n=1 Tax=Anguilla anguilla TaxID=7936 RepID=A0A0E9TGL5_ANGAN